MIIYRIRKNRKSPARKPKSTNLGNFYIKKGKDNKRTVKEE